MFLREGGILFDKILDSIKESFSWLSLPTWDSFGISSFIEILILAFLIYQLIMWIKNTRAWTLFKGIVVVIIFAIVAYLLKLTTILWIFTKTFNVIVISIFILFQPELRRALEQLGRKNIVSSIFDTSNTEEKVGKNMDKCHNEIVKAVFEMAKVRTGALIVMEKQVLLNEYERTGIAIDSLVSSQLLINIFEKNTPLHDGAVFIRDNRVVAATCYLPLSDNEELSKALGTRHRAAVGISEVSDSVTIVVSEETGSVSVAKDGRLYRSLSAEELKKELAALHRPNTTTKTLKLKRLKGIIKNEKKTNR